MEIRPARPEDRPAIWSILEPMIRAGDTYALAADMSEADVLGYWFAPEAAEGAEHAELLVLATVAELERNIRLSLRALRPRR